MNGKATEDFVDVVVSGRLLATDLSQHVSRDVLHFAEKKKYLQRK